jgi:hypothetical protein
MYDQIELPHCQMEMDRPWTMGEPIQGPLLLPNTPVEITHAIMHMRHAFMTETSILEWSQGLTSNDIM